VREWIILEINKWISSFREITKEKIIKRFPPEFIPFFREGNDKPYKEISAFAELKEVEQ